MGMDEWKYIGWGLVKLFGEGDVVKNRDEKDIPETLVLAQDFQKARQYRLSRKLYSEFFSENPKHPLRFKALFEVADNWFHEKNAKEAIAGFLDFIEYCEGEKSFTDEEIGWINAYRKLAESRIQEVEKWK